MKLEKLPFGARAEADVDLYVLSNDNSMVVKVSTYGGIVTSLSVPDRTGIVDDVVCGFDTLHGYLSDEYCRNSPYFGCVVGRYAGRIRNGTFSVDGSEYTLATNSGPHHLHGGIRGFDKRIWNCEPFDNDGTVGVNLYLNSADGDEGYPGNMAAEVSYTLTSGNALVIDYRATTDCKTPLSLTNHTYFNLNGFRNDVLNHELWINADERLVTDKNNVALGELRPVDGPHDFRTMRRVGDAFDDLPDGFDDYYIFRDDAHGKREVALLSDPSSGRQLKIVTSEPGVQLYTASQLSDVLRRESGARFGRFRGLCLETSKFPNGPNIKSSPRSILSPGEPYDETTEFHFSW